MSETIAIEVGKLDASPKNVRKTYNADIIAQLAANIAANDLLQNLIVYPRINRGR
ncbi:hypothetical protein ACFOEZ_20310 [Tianweitania populi]|uniref:Uncharacterized protein n=1 Tax=Tianweitania populi TaxID=1607949 RepID=A0A8J3DXM7_9HYPH|nr:hypothetical protein [Tianweitania populi]GHD20967.1 hypothetical protein GCM10016234_34110 [Tianweitania populi]